jgi:peptidyl-prolyl cis-trans isomerase C
VAHPGAGVWPVRPYQKESSMTLRAIFTLVLTLLATPLWAQATKPAVVNDPVVARVNGFELHRSDIEEAARGLPPQAQKQEPDKLYAAILDQLVATTLVAQAARKSKLQDDPRIKRRLVLIQDQVMAQLYVDDMVRKGMSEQKIKARYDKVIKDVPAREEVNARHILLGSEAEANAVIDQLKKGADFAALAKEKSTDPAGKTSGGDLGWFSKDQMVPEFADVVFKMKKGELTEHPVKTNFGWHVIKLEDRRTAPPPTYDQAKQQLADEIAREMIGEKMKELKTAAKIEVFNGDGSRPSGIPSTSGGAPSQGGGAAPGVALPGAAAPEPGVPTLSPATKPKE